MNLDRRLTLATKIPWIEDELRLLPRLVGLGAVCLDLGAGLGVYSYTLAAVVGHKGRVLAVEPRPSAASRIRRVARMLGLRQIGVAVCAVAARPGRSSLVVPIRHLPVPGRAYLADLPDGNGTRTQDHFLERELRPGRRREVPVRTIDDLRTELDRPVDFVKIDVEGAEHAVFSGAARLLAEDRPLVLCEIEDRHARRYGQSRRSVLELVAGYDYEAIPLVNRNDPSAVRNYLLVPAERLAQIEPLLLSWRAEPPGPSAEQLDQLVV
jgi:FkbM family methyltransferase